VAASVEVTELMGNEVFLYLKAGERNFVGRVDPRNRARVGERVQVWFNMDNLHIFDRDSEAAIR
jgi:multiple sugar transport system ATP-binding protein